VKALVFHEPKVMEVADLPLKRTGPGEIRVRVLYAGVCGTDRRIFMGTKTVHGPRVIGHEFAGIVDEVGDGVTAWEPGQRVAVYPIVTCGRCHACREGRKNICLRRRTFGYEIDGGFADYVVVVAEAVDGGNVVALPDVVSDIAAAASEPVAAALQGVVRAGVRADDAVLIIGAGPIGIAHLELSRLHGASCVIVSEPDGERREGARRRGATHVINPADGPLAAQVRALMGNDGPRIAFVDAGVPALIGEALQSVRKGGRCVIFAGMPTGSRFELDPNTIHYGELDLVGSSGSTPELQAQVLTWASEGRLDLESYVSEVLALDDWPQAFSETASAAGLKVVFGMGQSGR
jgi:L-iditol 2-dehydrogenase